MRKGFLLIAVLLVLSGLTATAQIPVSLQIVATNGTVAVFSSSNSVGAYGIGQFETTTNLSPPIVWTKGSANFEVLGGGMLFNSPATNAQEFFPIFSILPRFSNFAIFYNLNMEIDPGQPMDVNGPVFCNAGIWAGASALTFNSMVDAVGQVVTNATDPFADNFTGTGNPTFTLAGQPTSGNQSLTIPILHNTNAEAILNLPPLGAGAPNFTAYAPSNQVYLYNECDLIISNAVYGTNGIASRTGLGTSVNTLATNLTIWYQDSKNAAPLQKLTNDFILLKRPTGTYSNTILHTIQGNSTNYASTNILYAGWSFVTNVKFFDWRESDTVQAIQIDIAKLQRWLTNRSDGTGSGGTIADSQIRTDFGHGIGSIYAYNNVPLTSTTIPAVRLVNGSCLPTNYPGLTVATPQPVYIYGNYNVSNSIGSDLGMNRTTHTYPAAILADAITILSINWSDSYTNELPTGTIHGAGDTTVNTAMLEGIVQTDSTISGDYSGGVENFLRLLEDWQTTGSSGHRGILTYNGSMVAMFPSQYATNHWQPTGNYYNAPVRNWAFDLNFEAASGLPPLTPQVVNFVSP